MNYKLIDSELSGLSRLTQSMADGIADSYVNHEAIVFVLRAPFRDRQLVGTVVLIDQYLRRIRLELTNDEYEWVKMDDIVQIKAFI